MRTITFYRQARVDGGMRTGIDINGAPAWHRFQPGSEEPDPALLWFVDLECEAKNSQLPEDGSAARKWLREHASLIRKGLQELAEKLEVGFDAEEANYEYDIAGAPRGVRVKVICSAVRRLDARKIAEILDDTAARWEKLLAQLAPAEPVFAQGL